MARSRVAPIEALASYAACVSYVDAQVGRLLDELERSKQIEQTMIILWSDHGWHLGEHSAWGKMTNYEVAARVPLIIAGPDIRAGRTLSLAELVNLYPTISELVNVEIPQHTEGESLITNLKHPGQKTDAVALSQYARFGNKYMGRAIRTARYRFVMWTEKKRGTVVARELYDEQADPHETKNLAADPKHADLIKRLETWLRKTIQ